VTLRGSQGPSRRTRFLLLGAGQGQKARDTRIPAALGASWVLASGLRMGGAVCRRRPKKPNRTQSRQGLRQRQLDQDLQAAYKDTYGRYMKPPERMRSSQWVQSIRSMPKSQILHQIRYPLLTMTGTAFVVCVLHCLLGVPAMNNLAAHTLLGSGLSLLLVFRTNSAYQRFQEGRKIWNDILDASRDIAFTLALYKQLAGSKRIRIIRTSLQAFPFVMQEHVRAHEAKNLQDRLHTLLDEAHKARVLLYPDKHEPRARATTSRPLRIISRMLMVINTIESKGDEFTNRERCMLLAMVNQLSHTVGRCERLVQTPVPQAYARHTTRFVSGWTLTLPFVLVGNLGWLTIPVTCFVTWALFGILEIGHVIEDPFRRSMDLTPISDAIYMDAEWSLDTTDIQEEEEREKAEVPPSWYGHLNKGKESQKSKTERDKQDDLLRLAFQDAEWDHYKIPETRKAHQEEEEAEAEEERLRLEEEELELQPAGRFAQPEGGELAPSGAKRAPEASGGSLKADGSPQASGSPKASGSSKAEALARIAQADNEAADAPEARRERLVTDALAQEVAMSICKDKPQEELKV